MLNPSSIEMCKHTANVVFASEFFCFSFFVSRATSRRALMTLIPQVKGPWVRDWACWHCRQRTEPAGNDRQLRPTSTPLLVPSDLFFMHTFVFATFANQTSINYIVRSKVVFIFQWMCLNSTQSHAVSRFGSALLEIRTSNKVVTASQCNPL